MPKCRVLKGKWSWKGVEMVPGQIIDAPSAEWIANRVADNGLVEPIADEPAIETAALSAPETAAHPRARARKV